jgi:fumarate reductase iron-sulfur subunit
VAEGEKTILIEVLRYRPEQDAAPVAQSYHIPFTDDMSVLQGLQYIKDHVDGTLSFRWSCRMAICGSCGMMIDGKPRLSCKTFLRDFHPDGVRVEALNHFPIERDLVAGVDDFMVKLERIKPYIIPKEPRSLEQGEYLQTPHQLEQYEQFSSCINCMLCYAAYRYNADSRDGGREQRMDLVNAEEGVWSCTAVGYCSEVCPKGVDPANAVNQNKVASAQDYFLRLLRPGRAGK